MRKPFNPFIVTGYHSPAYFCDRDEELAWLNDQFENDRNAVIYSWRRMGKTALISHFFHYLEKEKRGEGVFVDLLGSASISEANKRLATAIVSRFGDMRKGLGPKLMKLLGSIGATVGFDPFSGTPQITFDLLPGPSVPHSLESMGKFLAERKKPMVICIDEFQQVVSYKEPNAEAVFRSWVQQFPMVRFFFSGSHRNMMVSMFSEGSRPFYRSAQLRRLDSLDQGVYASFIRLFFKKAGKNINDSVMDAIFHWTRMQTYYVQLVCNKLYGKNYQIDKSLLGEVFSEILQQEIPLFSSYQQLLTTFQWKLLIAIARAEEVENPVSKNFLSTYGLGAASSVSTALKALVAKEFVIVEDKKHKLHDTLLMRWLQQL
jgi:uncharacterized protein